MPTPTRTHRPGDLRTPFALTASGSDPDGNPLTYCWEEADLGPNPKVADEPDDGANPIIRSYAPVASPTRIIPRLQELLNNQTQTRGEKLPTHYTCPMAVWQFGPDLTLVGLSGEVVVDYVTLLEKALGPNQLWVAGYCNDVFGYLPSARVLAEGGYETRGLISGGAGFFAPEAEGVVVRTVRELAAKAGRKLPE